MKNYPLKAAVFLTILSLAGAAAAVLIIIYNSAQSFNTVQFLIPLFIWIVIGIWSESFTVYLEDGNIHLSPIDAVFYAVYLTSGAVSALIVIPAAMLLRFRRTGLLQGHLLKTPFRLTLFNIAHYILILGVVELVYSSLCRLTGLSLLPALLSAPLFFLLSCLLNALFYKLEEGRSFFHYLKEIFLPHFINGLSASFAVVIIALAYPRFGFISLFFYFIPVFTTRLLYLESKEN